MLCVLLAAGTLALARPQPCQAREKAGKTPAAYCRAGGRAWPLIIVQFKRDASDVDIAAFLSAAGATAVERRPRHANQYVVRFPTADGVFDKAAAWERSPLVVWAQADCMRQVRRKNIPNDPLFYDQWAMRNTGQNGSMTNRDVSADTAWDITRGTQTVVVAVLDDGVELSHPDLATNAFINFQEYGGGKETNGVDDNSPTNGYVDDWQGWDFFRNTNSGIPIVADDNHGTWSAGVITAAADNGEGIAGLANRCRLLSVRVVSGGTVKSDLSWAEAIEYAASLADVISIGYYIDPTPVVSDAINYALTRGRGGKGCVVCIALGNDGVRRRYTTDAGAMPEVLSVSGVSNYDKRSFFSDYGPAVNVVCPAGGGNIDVLTTDRSLGESSNDYVCVNGTSMACPIAAAAAALIVSLHPEWTGLEVRQALEASCDKIDAAAWPYNERGWNEQYGFGRVNARAALTDPRPTWDPYEPDNDTNHAASIADGELQYRSLSTGSDVDWVRFAVSNSADIRVSAMGTTNVYLRLYSNATLIASNDAGIYPHLTASNLPAGAYYVKVDSPAAVAVSNYGLHLAFLNLPDEYENDNATNTAKTIRPREIQYRSFYPAGDVDWAKFILTTNAQVDIHTMGEWGGDTVLWLRNAAGAGLAYSDDINTEFNRYSQISTQLVAGAYYIEVGEFDDQEFASYELQMTTYEKDDHEPDNSASQAVAIASGGISSGTLYPSNDVDWLTFTLTNTANVLILTDAKGLEMTYFPEVDTELSLYRIENGSNTLVAYNDNGNGVGCSFSAIYQTGLSTGVYYIKACGHTGAEVSPNYYVSLDAFEKKTEMTSVTAASNGIAMTWAGDASYNYRVEYSTNLVNTQAWTVATNVEGRVGRDRWVDGSIVEPSPGTSTQRFYRAIVK